MASDQYGARLPQGALIRLGTVRPSREGDRVSALAFAADGNTLASGGEDGSVRLWNLETGRQVRRFGDHPKEVGAIAFVPDGKVLVSGSLDGTIAVWDVATGQERAIIHSPAGPLAFFIVDDNTLLAGCTDEMYRGWDLTTGTEFAHDPTYLGPLKALAFFPDGHQVITGSWESMVRLCGLATGQELRQFQGHRSSIQALAVSPDARTVLSASADETIRLWEVRTVKERLQFANQKEGVFALAIAPDGRTLASAGSDTTILIWDLTGWPPVRGSVRQTVKLMPSQLEMIWQGLASADAGTAYRAIWGLAAAAAQTVPFLKKRLPLLVPVDRQRINVLLAELNHDQIGRRDEAQQELEKIGGLCEPLLRTAVQKPTSMDARRRLERVLEKLQGQVPSPSTLHVLRIVEALECANTTESREVLEGMSREEPPTCIAHEAKASLERLARWPVG